MQVATETHQKRIRLIPLDPGVFLGVSIVTLLVLKLVHVLLVVFPTATILAQALAYLGGRVVEGRHPRDLR